MALILSVKVVTSSGRNKFILDKAGTLKIYLKSPPERGKANQELVTLLSKELGLPGSAVEILAGLTNPNKRLKIQANLTLEQVLDKLGIQTQMTFFNKKD
ncbi:hypothetical protein BH09DEP1_BH09DEP1_7910 [soil metagenome]